MQAESEQSCLYIYLQPSLGKVSDPAQPAHGESQVDLQVMHSAAKASHLACGGRENGGICHIFERKPMSVGFYNLINQLGYYLPEYWEIEK